MHCLLAGVGRYDGMVERPPGPDGGPPPEVEIVAARRLARVDPGVGDVYNVDVIVFRFEGMTPEGVPRYIRDRDVVEERTGSSRRRD